MKIEALLNTSVSFPFLEGTITTLAVYKSNGVLASTSEVISSFSNGTPNVVNLNGKSSGDYIVYINLKPIFIFSVVKVSNSSLIADLHDEALGSWKWDKQANTLIVYRKEGDVLSNFNVTDTMTLSTKQRV